VLQISSSDQVALAFTIYSALFFMLPATGQDWSNSVCADDDHATFHACALQAKERFEPPRTAAGHPDLQGIWARRARAHESLHAHPQTLDDFEAPSIIVAPADGFAPMQPWAEAKRRYNRPAYVHQNAICRLSGIPGTMYMTGTYQFMQSEDYVLVQSEEAHAFRVIPMDGRPHIGDAIQLWNGDSIGRWDGNTFVVETRNQNARAWLDQRARFYTDEALVTERFTLIDPNTMHWEATIEDPNVYSEAFTIALAYRRRSAEGAELWEEACYEDNDLASETYRNVGYELYPGITGAEARRLKSAWELEDRELEWKP